MSAAARLLTSVALLCLGVASAGAHPHVWVSVECTFRMDAEGRVVALAQRWTYDAMYSSYALYGLHQGPDGTYALDGLGKLLDTMRAPLEQAGYFTTVRVEGMEEKLAAPQDAAVQVGDDGQLILSFSQSLPQPMARGKELRIEVRDVEYFVDFEFSKEAYGTVSPPTEGCLAALSDGAPPAGADPIDVMKALINGPVQTLGSSVTLRCR